MSTSPQCVLCQALGVRCMCLDMVPATLVSSVNGDPTSYEGGPLSPLDSMHGAEYHAVVVLHIPSATDYHDPGAEFLDTPEAQLASSPPATESQASCPAALCQWRDKGASVICGAVISCEDVPTHFQFHGIKSMNESKSVVCRWEGCCAEGMRKNFARHIRECHLNHIRNKGHSS